jgi:hypothetical protein
MNRFWLGIASLLFINTLDIVLLEIYMKDQWQYETFPPLAYSIQHFGLKSAVWLIRILFYGLLFGLMCMPRTKYLNYFVLTLNLIYWIPMLDWLFVLHEMGKF